MHIYTDDRGTFWFVFAFCFTSCYSLLPQFGVLHAIQQFEIMFNRDQNFRGNSFTQND